METLTPSRPDRQVGAQAVPAQTSNRRFKSIVMQANSPSQVFYEKTESGHREALSGQLPITRPVRTLLLVINATQPLEYWLANVRGVCGDDVLWLEQHGLVIDASHQKADTPSAEASGERQVWMHGLALIEQANPLALRETMKKAAWATLRGLRAYHFVEDLQSCQDAQEIRQAARCLLSQIWSEHGVDALRQVIGTLDGSSELTLAGTAMPTWRPAVAPPATDAPIELPAAVAAAVQASAPTAPAEIRTPLESYRLGRWPAPQLLQDPRHVRLATLLMARTVSQAQLVVMSRCDAEVVNRFLSALQAQPGLLKVVTSGHNEIAGNARTPVSSPATARDSSASQASSARSARQETMGLLGRLRNRLGLH